MIGDVEEMGEEMESESLGTTNKRMSGKYERDREIDGENGEIQRKESEVEERRERAIPLKVEIVRHRR